MSRIKSSKIKPVVKNVATLRRLEKLGFLVPDQSFIPYLFSISLGLTVAEYQPADAQAPTASSEARRQIFRSLAYVLGYAEKQTGAPASASDLMLAIQRAAPKGPLAGHSGIVRLLLFYGADPMLPDIPRFVCARTRNPVAMATGSPLANDELYRGLNTDIKQAIHWKKWIDERSIMDMPPEVSTEIMMWLWQD